MRDCDHQRSAEQCGNRVQVLVQEQWHLVDENVADHAAADRRGRTDQGRRQRTGVVVQRDDGAGAREQAHPQCVERQDFTTQSIERLVEVEHGE